MLRGVPAEKKWNNLLIPINYDPPRQQKLCQDRIVIRDWES